MRSIRLTRDAEQWIVKYDEHTAALTVEGPSPTDSELFQWLTTPRLVIDKGTGEMVLAAPVDSWSYLTQAIDIDLHGDLRLAPQWDIGEDDPGATEKSS